MIKRIFNTLGVLFALSVTLSCNSEVESLFADAPEMRILQSENKYNDVLVSADNGWLMQYYPNAYQENTEDYPQYGGFNLIVKFTKDGHAIFSSEKAGDDVTAKSTYSIKQSSGVIISFDTYNKVLHYFSDPANIDGVGKKGWGYGGDFEFRIISAEPNKVVMKGLKRNSTIVLTPMKGAWNKYFEAIHKTDFDITYGAYLYKVGKQVANVSRTNNFFTFIYKDKNGSITKQNAPFIVTPSGVEFHDTLSILDAKVKSLTFDNNTNIFKSDGNSGATLQGIVLPLNEALTVGPRWYLSIDNIPEALHPLWQAAAQNLMGALQEELKLLCFFEKFILFQSGRYQGMFECDLKKEGSDIISIQLKGFAGNNAQQGNARYYFTKVDGFKNFILTFNGKYKITTDNMKNPSWLLLTSVDNPGMTLKLVRKEVKPY